MGAPLPGAAVRISRNRIARELRGRDLRSAELLQKGLLLPRRLSVDALVDRAAELLGEAAVELAGIPA